MNVRITAGTVLTATIATLTLLLTTATVPAQAQDKMGGKMEKPKMDHKMGKMTGKMMKPAVYVSKDTKMYYSEADAMKMKMMDSKGKKMMKMDKAPMGYKMGHRAAGKMDHKMDKMDHKMDKMDHKMDHKM
jgi:hypothetical protein